MKFSAQLFVYDTSCHTEGGVFFLQLSLSLSLLLLLLSLLSLKCRRKRRRRPTSVPPQVASVSVPVPEEHSVSHKSKQHPGLLHVFMCLSLCDISNFDFNIGDTFDSNFLWNLLIGCDLGAAQKQTPPCCLSPASFEKGIFELIVAPLPHKGKHRQSPINFLQKITSMAMKVCQFVKIVIIFDNICQ